MNYCYDNDCLWTERDSPRANRRNGNSLRVIRRNGKSLRAIRQNGNCPWVFSGTGIARESHRHMNGYDVLYVICDGSYGILRNSLSSVLTLSLYKLLFQVHQVPWMARRDVYTLCCFIGGLVLNGSSAMLWFH